MSNEATFLENVDASEEVKDPDFDDFSRQDLIKKIKFLIEDHSKFDVNWGSGQLNFSSYEI